LLLASIYYNMQTAISRDSNLHILPLRYKSIRKPLWIVLPYYFITLRSITYNKVLSTTYADVLGTVSSRGALIPRDIELIEPLAE